MIKQETSVRFSQEADKLNLPAHAMDMAAEVLLFMTAFEQPIRHHDLHITGEDFVLARKLMAEEIDEMWRGFENFRRFPSIENKTEFVDGAIDTIYVILWSLLKMGVPVNECFAEVQRSNMAKLNPDGSFTKNEFGKVKKPAGWTAPDLHGILMRHGTDKLYRNGVMQHGESES